MAHSNRYFHMKVKDDRYVDLTARTPEYGEVGEVFDNMIQMTVHGPVYGTRERGEVGIWLTEKEQDDLIAGILERRGKLFTVTDGLIRVQRCEPISATGNEQSAIHPAEV